MFGDFIFQMLLFLSSTYQQWSREHTGLLYFLNQDEYFSFQWGVEM